MIIDNGEEEEDDDVDEVVTDHATGPRSLKINSWLRLRPAVGKSQSLGIITIGIIIMIHHPQCLHLTVRSTQVRSDLAMKAERHSHLPLTILMQCNDVDDNDNIKSFLNIRFKF